MMANITGEILVMLAPSIPKNLKKDGVLILSGIIESRLDDDCTLESVLKDNAEFLSYVQKHNLNYILIDDKYEIDI